MQYHQGHAGSKSKIWTVEAFDCTGRMVKCISSLTYDDALARVWDYRRRGFVANMR